MTTLTGLPMEQVSTGDLEEVAKSFGIDVSQLKGGGGAMEPEYGSTEGQDFWPRAQAGFKSTPKERFSFWQEKLGKGNVTASDQGDILWKHPSKGWQRIDESGFSMADIADFAGDVPELVGMMLTSRVPGGSFVRGALGAGGGNIVKQGVEQALPGEAQAEISELGSSVVLGGVANKVGDVAAGMLTRPASYVKEKLIQLLTRNADASEGLGSQFAKEGVRLSEKFDVPLTASQITQGPFEKTMAGYAARSPFGIAAFEKHEVLAQQKALAAAERLVGQLHPERLTEEGLGSRVRMGLDRAKAGLENTLYRQMEKDFAFLDRSLGGRSVIPAEHFRVYLEKQAQYYTQPGMPAEAGKLARELAKMADGIPNGTLSARAIEEHLKRLGAASYGKEPLFESLTQVEKAGQTRIAKEAYQALLRDLDDAAAGSNANWPQQGPVARLLRSARDNTAANSAAIDNLAKTTLARFGFSPATQGRGVEKMAKWFTTAVREPSEVRNAMEVLEAADPGMAQQVGAYIVEQAIQAGRMGGRGELAAFDRNEMLKNLPRPEVLKALFPKDARAGTQIATDMAEFSELLARSLWQGGQRPVLQASPFKSASSIVAQETLFGKARTALESIIVPKAVAAFETDPVARKEIFAIVKRIQEGGQMTKSMEAAVERLLMKGISLGTYEVGANVDPRTEPNRAPQ